MDNFLYSKQAAGIILVYFIALHSGNLPVFAENVLNEDCKQKTGVEVMTLDKVKLPPAVIDLMTKMANPYMQIAQTGIITKEDVLNLKKQNKLYQLADKLIDHYQNISNKEDGQLLLDIGRLIDENQDDYSVVFAMKVNNSSPYPKGTRYSVFSLTDAENTY